MMPLKGSVLTDTYVASKIVFAEISLPAYPKLVALASDALVSMNEPEITAGRQYFFCSFCGTAILVKNEVGSPVSSLRLRHHTCSVSRIKRAIYPLQRSPHRAYGIFRHHGIGSPADMALLITELSLISASLHIQPEFESTTALTCSNSHHSF